METTTLLAEARDWMSDLELLNRDGTLMEPEDLADLSDTEVQAFVSRQFAGGWDAFVLSC